MAAANRETRVTSFAGVPRIVMDSSDYINLSSGGRSLTLEFAYQYKGKNNGNLSATFKQMKARGFKSPTTLSKIIKELVAANIIIKTRQGGKNYPCLYALTWQPIDECRGKNLELSPTITAPRKFSLEQKSPMVKTKSLGQKLYQLNTGTVLADANRRVQ